MRVAVIGTGLIGTSIALALREHGSSVWLADADPAAARLARAEGLENHARSVEIRFT